MTLFFKELEIRIPADVSVARHCAGQMAHELDFPAQRQAEVRLISSELAQNHLDHRTRGGLIRLSGFFFGDIPCLTIASLDHGPGIDRVGAILNNGNHPLHSTTGLGAGLVSIRRLADCFSLCTGKEGPFGCPRITGLGSCATMIVARCWPDSRGPEFFSSGESMDIGTLVAGRSETAPCGDNIFVRGDSRFVRTVIVDSPGMGRGGEATREIGEYLYAIDLIWPPDQVLESLAAVLAAETAIMVVRYDQLQQEVSCSGVGNISTWFGIDGRVVRPPLQSPLAGSGWHGLTNTVYRVYHSLVCLLHTDGLLPFSKGQVRAMVSRLGMHDSARPENRRAEILFLLQLAFSADRRKQDDAALFMAQWQR